MDSNGQTPAGSSDRRRTTVSGPLPPRVDARIDADAAMKSTPDYVRGLWSSSPSAPASPAAAPPSSPGSSSGKQASHKRSLSGNLLAKFNFLKGVVEDGRPPSRDKEALSPQNQKSPRSTKSPKSVDNEDAPESPISPAKGESAMTFALKATQTRKRKGSLRKTALLGTRRLVTETREMKNSFMQRSPSSKQPPSSNPPPPIIPSTRDCAQSLFVPESDNSKGIRSRFSYENVEAMSSSDSGWNESTAATSARLSLLTDNRAQQEHQRKSSGELTSPLDLKSPTSNASYTSTTDDDDVLTFDCPVNSFVGSQGLKKPLSTAATSYFPSLASVSDTSMDRRLSIKPRPSPLSHNITTLSTYSEPEPHDYTETEYWGWVILFVTWLTFAVGMGSCLEIWSWAWDVGETPYAPPELEDDPTLPIVGYYPALMVLTGVVAWVWITVAWVGMKYFRHAKIEV